MRNVDLMRRHIRVVEAVADVNGVLIVGTPKTHQTREVPLPRFLVDLLVEHAAGLGPDDLVFTTTQGSMLRPNNFRRDAFDRAAIEIGREGLTPHELRHTAASLAISAGASIKAVQAMLGHASAVMTLDLYGHLFPDELDAVADRLDVAARAAEDSLRTAGASEVVELRRKTL